MKYIALALALLASSALSQKLPPTLYIDNLEVGGEEGIHSIFANDVKFEHPERLIVIPQPSRETQPEKTLRYTLLANTALARAADWASTQQCLRTDGCREALLPAGLARSKPGLALFEAGMVGLQWYSSSRLAKKHPKLAIAISGMQMLTVSYSVGHNYKVISDIKDKKAAR